MCYVTVSNYIMLVKENRKNTLGGKCCTLGQMLVDSLCFYNEKVAPLLFRQSALNGLNCNLREIIQPAVHKSASNFYH